MTDFKQYIKELQSIPIDEITEHSKRFALETILRELAVATRHALLLPAINVLHEPKRKDNYGSPDFKIYSENSIIGYVENKKITENLDKIIKSQQIKKYRELSQNLLITNYIEFIWIKGDVIQRETLCYLSDIENKKFKLDNEKAEKIEKLLLNFFSQAPEKISLPKDLALALAVRCKNLKDFINDELTRQNEQNEKERLYNLYNAFKDNIFTELTISEFSDAFAQMLTYGLFLAGLNADTVKTGHALSLYNAKKYIPSSFQLIKELINFLDELEKPEYKETKWIIDETISIINNIQWFDLKQNLSFSKRIKDNENIEIDPYIYFYETFLATYDYNLRKSKGVYYTPPQVVNFIVRAIDEILINTFKLSSGFAERNKVTVLDFATGTGTFLLEIFKIILDNIPKESLAKREMIIKEHILQNLYGFEYLIAPYTIAHLKLSQFLKESGYEFQDKERLQVYLTNTLEPVDKQVKLPFLPQLSKETQSAQKVKDTPILVITGNPPFSGISKNNGAWITDQINKYKFVDGAPFNERKHWLNDDYVKFIRFAQDKMDKAEQGIVGIITNHSFLDNPTFRGMRQSLMNTFDQLYFIDLHGNSLKKETTPEGEKDENVFDIKQGVCISILVKKKGINKGVYHTDFWGKRNVKYDLCLENSLQTIEFNELKPSSPDYLFIQSNSQTKLKYDAFKSITEIFHLNNTGVCSQRDIISMQSSEIGLLKVLKDFQNLTEREIKEKYKLSKDGRDWKISYAKQNVINCGILPEFIKTIHYRPFDNRITYYTDKSKGFIAYPRYNVFKHLLQDNYGLLLNRTVKGIPFNHSFITKYIPDLHLFETANASLYCFPLYLYEKQNIFDIIDTPSKTLTKKEKELAEQYRLLKIAENEFLKHKKIFYSYKQPTQEQVDIYEEHKQSFEVFNAATENLKNSFDKEFQNIKEIEKKSKKNYFELLESGYLKQPNYKSDFYKFIENKYNRHVSPENILGYVYSILHSKTYREKYIELLRLDFPKIPFTNDFTVFEKLSDLGFELIQKHLLNEIPNNKTYKQIGIYKGEGDNTVVKPDFKIEKSDNETKYKLYINKTQYFETVPENVYNFQIGGYQVLDKYLKDRKNNTLIYDEIDNIENTLKVLTFTINQMELIDNETKNWI